MKNFIRKRGGQLMAHLLRKRSRPYEFSAGTALVVAPHADDETLGCGGLLAVKSRRRENVHVVFVTDSAGSPEETPVAGQAERRQAEAVAALAVLGIGPEKIHRLQLPDGRLNRLSAAETARARAGLDMLLHRLQPDEIFVPYLGGGSSEHDATTLLVRAVLAGRSAPVRVWEYPVWAWWDFRRLAPQLSRTSENFHLELGNIRALKLSALARHASQHQPGPGGEPPLPPVLAALCTGPTEFFFNRQP